MSQTVDNGSTPEATPVLEARHITKRFGAFGAIEALVDVDLVVHRHEVVALVGDNAAGKSTLARIITGVYQPTSGTLKLAGRETTVDSPGDAFRQGVATVFQELALCDNLDVVANIFLGREMHTHGYMDQAEMEKRARHYLDLLGSKIPNVRAPLASLSGGQRQCVAIARTLVGSPRLVVLDEPTAALSVGQTAEVLSHIQHLRDMGLGVILISHNLTDVRSVADRVEVLRHGKNNGSFDAHLDSYEEIIAAITGAPKINRRPEGGLWP